MLEPALMTKPLTWQTGFWVLYMYMMYERWVVVPTDDDFFQPLQNNAFKGVELTRGKNDFKRNC